MGKNFLNCELRSPYQWRIIDPGDRGHEGRGGNGDGDGDDTGWLRRLCLSSLSLSVFADEGFWIAGWRDCAGWLRVER